MRVARQHLLRQHEALGHVAIRQRRDKGALHQIDILRIGAQAFAKKVEAASVSNSTSATLAAR